MKKTKIICTLGPSTDDEQILKTLMLNGMDVVRINMSHQTQESHKARIDKVKKVRDEVSLPIAILLDTKGPEIRTGTFTETKVKLYEGQKFTLTTRDVMGDKSIVSVSFKGLPKDVSVGTKILIDDGLVGLKVMRINGTEIECEVTNGGEVSSNKGVNIPGIALSLPFMNQKDRDDIKFAVEQDVDFIAASFTRTEQDILEMRRELSLYGGDHIKVIAKIENHDGVNNIESIIEVADGIMIARGDLGVEIALEEIPIIQKEFIKKTCNAGKLVVTATQMLESMVSNPRPTRAEATDVANAIYDGTSAIMLSGETAAGKYPVESLQTMSRIAERTEQDIDYAKRFQKMDMAEKINVTSAISHATCTTAHDLDVASIVTVTKSGRTARMISKYKPCCNIIAGTTSELVRRQLNLYWGVIPIMIEDKSNTDELFEHVIDKAKESGLVVNGDLVVITAGVPLSISGMTNLLKVHLVGRRFDSINCKSKASVDMLKESIQQIIDENQRTFN